MISPATRRHVPENNNLFNLHRQNLTHIFVVLPLSQTASEQNLPNNVQLDSLDIHIFCTMKFLHFPAIRHHYKYFCMRVVRSYVQLVIIMLMIMTPVMVHSYHHSGRNCSPTAWPLCRWNQLWWAAWNGSALPDVISLSNCALSKMVNMVT
jgi:hypothetical protein